MEMKLFDVFIFCIISLSVDGFQRAGSPIPTINKTSNEVLLIALLPSPSAPGLGQDQARGGWSEDKGPRGTASAKGMQVAWPDQRAAHSMALMVQFQQNSHAESFFPAVKANNYCSTIHRGKREEGEASVRKHQTQLGCVRWESRRGVREPNPPRETKTQVRTGTGMLEYKCKINNKRRETLAMKRRHRGRGWQRAAR